MADGMFADPGTYYVQSSVPGTIGGDVTQGPSYSGGPTVSNGVVGGGGGDGGAQAAMAALFNQVYNSSQAQMEEKIREFNQTFPLSVAQETGLYSPYGGGPAVSTLPALLQAGYTYGPGGVSAPTLAAQAQYAGLTGMLPGQLMGQATGSGPTIGTQALTGFLNMPGQGQVATVQEQQQQLARMQMLTNAYQKQQQMGMQAITDILNANQSPANAFSYLSKLRGIQNLGPAASLLRGGLMGATGQSLAQLAAQPNMTNSQLMSSLFGNLLGTATGQPAGTQPGTNPSDFLSTLYSALGAGQPQGMAAPQGATGIGAGQQFAPGNRGFTPQQQAQLNASLAQMSPADRATSMLQSLGATGANPQGPTNLPTGWGTSLQAYNQMAPSLQGALTNMVQTYGGENPKDFIAGMKAAAPEFQKSAYSNVGISGRF